MARKPKKEEHVNHERWLVSYADFITLLFAFFTALYAISTVDAKKAGKMIFSTKQAFNVEFFPSDQPTLGASTLDPGDMASVREAREKVVADKPRMSRMNTTEGPPSQGLRHMQTVLDTLRKAVREQKLAGLTVRAARNNVVISLKDAAFFEPGGVKIRRSSLPELDAIAEKILATRLDVRVEGHTDDTPPSPHQHRSNWELSTQRATAVVGYFIEQFAFPPESLSVAGYASYRPMDPNDTDAARANNRRVDIVLLTPQAPPPPPPQEGGEPAAGGEPIPAAPAAPAAAGGQPGAGSSAAQKAAAP